MNQKWQYKIVNVVCAVILSGIILGAFLYVIQSGHAVLTQHVRFVSAALP